MQLNWICHRFDAESATAKEDSSRAVAQPVRAEENSPPFQGWVEAPGVVISPVRGGREPRIHAILSAVPVGLISSSRRFPTVETVGYFHRSLRDNKPSGPRPHSAFTLIEIIGVLTVLSILVALLLPSCIKRIDIATRNQEKVNLAGIAGSLTMNVLRGANVPDHTTWNTRAANWSEMPVSKVSTNARRYQRVYYSLDNPSVTLPYAQDYNGLTAPPQRMRAVVVSILGGDTLGSGNSPTPGPLTDAQFTALWDLPDGARPTGAPWASWLGRGDDFLVSKIDYAPLFHRLVLVNRDPNITPTFRIEDYDAVSLPKSSPNYGWDRYYVNGTVIGLCDAAGVPETRYVLTQDISFVFENGMWRAQIMGGVETSSTANEFAKQAARFLDSMWRPNAKGGADQQTALIPMYAFMLTYTYWADLCPHYPIRAPSAAQQPEFELITDFAGGGGSTGHGLDEITGVNGLLNK